MQLKITFVFLFGVAGLLFMAGTGLCDDSIYLCGVDVKKGASATKLKERFRGCRVQELGSDNIILQDDNNKLVGNIIVSNNKVATAYKRWNSYANTSAEEIEAIMDAINCIKPNQDDVMDAKIVTSDRKEPTNTIRDIEIIGKKKSVKVTVIRFKTSPGAAISIDERLL